MLAFFLIPQIAFLTKNEIVSILPEDGVSQCSSPPLTVTERVARVCDDAVPRSHDQDVLCAALSLQQGAAPQGD
jgi:hypothetical protein